MRERDTVWVVLEGKERPAVVLEVRSDLIRIAYGTSQEHAWPGEVVHADTRQGRKFPLRETTYFYGANTMWALPRELRPGAAQCAWEFLFAIRKLVESHDASIMPD